jgi:hypothetical protein
MAESGQTSTPTPERKGTETRRYPLTSLETPGGDGLVTEAPHEHQTRARVQRTFDPAIVRAAIGASFAKLDPRAMARNPVMFVVEIGSAVTSVVAVSETIRGAGDAGFV